MENLHHNTVALNRTIRYNYDISEQISTSPMPHLKSIQVSHTELLRNCFLGRTHKPVIPITLWHEQDHAEVRLFWECKIPIRTCTRTCAVQHCGVADFVISDSAVSCPPHRPQCRIRKPYFFQNLKCISYHADDPLISVNYVYLSWRVKYRKCRALADRQVVMEMSSGILWRVVPPFPSLQSTVCLWPPPPWTHARLLDALALLPYSRATLSPSYLLFPPFVLP